jgi:hypothetical protein
MALQGEDEEVMERIRSMISVVRQHHGLLVGLWGNRSLTSVGRFPDWQNRYEQIIGMAL